MNCTFKLIRTIVNAIKEIMYDFLKKRIILSIKTNLFHLKLIKYLIYFIYNVTNIKKYYFIFI